ncbi:hypothetical protein PHYBLDRAFT_70035 [Phycomyces blakesleeanus NRRL 1555(-)]|uniref:Uncharacterized protein n=1 Tax=Phycomyces blakesleeanus (strain ATCC 8743b / DSM 1359 / FGSC 10004 / NBRC 33097 / NRRL 1555) TaxID=763407 RepID=A0A163A7R8_PHYB8|nr:hypothetical protein PHYBLDRAFT_70035 [Phycomyces blakesleeanus NRRL 1555(-)]OAD71631.1 hypothetical protein PHYBLDRAFT_70035 [Phycomyces blakesleeanus NRRL 1555(-)]|eukprot:XP_018289671.1 hypothetical protein PHYBLDRAFT_70035 [Phycomyces blakesleeanus NRRL 1555(-)]
MALYTIHAEMLEDVTPGKPCHCTVKVVFGLPYHHSLLRDRVLTLANILEKWLLSSVTSCQNATEDIDAADSITIKESAPWMKSVSQLEKLFWHCEGEQQVCGLMAKVNNFIENAKQYLDHPEMVFSVASEVKAAGRPKHIKKKDEIQEMIKQELRDVVKECLEEEPLKKSIKKIKKEKEFAKEQEPLEEGSTHCKKWQLRKKFYWTLFFIG